jgi:hypothetical protein
MIVTMTRAELHALVWDRPMTKLAAEYSLSDVALHKVCRKHDVPTPPAGYWAKKAHGKPVKVTPLPRPDEAGSISIREGEASEEGVSVAKARASIRTTLADWEPTQEAPASSNAIVERTIAKLKTAKPKRTGLITIEGSGLITVTVQPESVERAARILRLLVDAADRAGISLDATRRPAVWQFEGEEVSFTLEEATDRVEHVPTDKELRAVARWEAEREAYFKRSGYWRDWGKPEIPKWEERYQGRLAVGLEKVRVQSDDRWWGPVIRRGFADTRTRDLANLIPRILATVAAIAVAKRENRGVEERRRIAEEEAAHRYEAARRREARERARLSALERLIEEHQRQQQLEALVEALEQHAPADDAPRVEGLRGWARERLERLRGETFGRGLEARLAQLRLFGEGED